MSHYYTRDGQLVAQVPMSTKEGMRDTTISDARRLGLLPSVTTILGLLNRPMLNNWRVEQAVEKALDGGYFGTRPEIVKAVIKASEEYRDYAADFGTAVHQGIAARLTGERVFPGLLGVAECLEGFWGWFTVQGFECEKAEQTFVDLEHGYASTLDMLGWWQGKRVLADFKTQDAETERDFSFYEEYPLQLAGYALGIGEPDITRLSVAISRTVPGVCAIKVWPDNERDVAAWVKLLELWKLLKKWEC